MIRSTLIFLFLGIITLFSACDTDTFTCIRVSSTEVTETRDIKNYSGVVLANVATLKITQGQEYAFKIQGPENVVELTYSRVQNDLLVIGTDECFNGDYELIIELTAPDFKVFNLTGIGAIETMNTINTDIIEVDLIGIGSIEAAFNADTIYTNIAGQAIVKYYGQAHRHELESSGEFSFKGFPLSTNHTQINITGEGDSEVTANESLRVFIEGAGNVYYMGDPLIDSDITGVGEIIDAN